MRWSRQAPWLWIFIVLVIIAPILSACAAPPVPPPLTATIGKPLPQVVEAYMADLPGPSPKLFLSTEIYDRHGTRIGEFWNEGHRYWVPLDRISPLMRKAIVATEDKTFYSNPGVDWGAIARAVLENSNGGELFSGASTITQQLARNIAYPYEQRVNRSLDRKLGETYIAQDLTARFSKDQILEMYLNVVYFGHLAYGVEAAARTYFAKSAADLTLAEAALLAAMPQSPAELDPFVDADRPNVKERQGLVLALMARAGFISQEAAEAAYRQPLKYQTAQLPKMAPYFMDYVNQAIDSRFGQGAVGRLGLTVTTTLDVRLQQVAEDLVRKQVSVLRAPYNLGNAALVALLPSSGEIVAMVGGADYYAKVNGAQVNVAISPRQPGSAIKPILYTLAFTRGFSPASVIWDIPVTFKLDAIHTYAPTNYDLKFHGPVRLRTALANSLNVVAVKLLSQVGVPDMVAMGRSMGLQGLDRPVEQYGLSLTLGGSEVTLLSLTNAYATIDNGGRLAPSTPIIAIRDSGGQVIDGHKPAANVVDPRVEYLVTSILSDNEARAMEFGTNSPLHLSRPAAAKTGTTTDFRDNWTVGYTPYLAVGVWAGNTDGTPMRNTTGLTGAAPIWHDFMETVFSRPELDAAVRDRNAPLDFTRPDGIVEAPICLLSSLKGAADCPEMRNELFLDPAKPLAPTLLVSGPISASAALALAGGPADGNIALKAGANGARSDLASGSIIIGPNGVTPTVAARIFLPGVPVAPLAAAGLAAPATQATPAASSTAAGGAGPAGIPADPAVALVQLSSSGRGQCVTDQGGRPMAVIRVPHNNLTEAQSIWRWAAASGIPTEPPSCATGTVADFLAPPVPLAGAVRAGQSAAVDPTLLAQRAVPAGAAITFPSSGSVVQGSVNIIGRAPFSQSDIAYYKVEFGSGYNPGTWITMGTGHSAPVDAGVLETWQAGSLGPGPYALRVVLVKPDGNYITSATVPVQVVR